MHQFVRLCLLVTLLAPIILLSAGVCHAETDKETKVKAAFIINFARFTSWPEDSLGAPGQPLSICLAGQDRFGDAFSGIEKQRIQDRKLKIMKIASLQAAGGCHLVFVGKSVMDDLSILFGRKLDQAAVTVSDVAGFSSNGGMIELVRKDDKLTFKINNSEAKKQHIKFDAFLLSLAEEVY